MDDVYGDLENYQFENVVSELRNENQELKCKLEEYASTVSSLQKDFDKLAAEYKKLELNYSSLLKTAKAEIERKSQLITNLNIEKDKLVIESIQNRGRKQNKKINATGNKQQSGKQLVKGDSAKEIHDAAVRNSTDNIVSVTLNPDRKDKHDKTVFSFGPTSKNDPDVKEKEQKPKKSDTYRDREKNKNEIKKSKEKHPDVLNNAAVVSKIDKIRNRRKSMPLLNRGDFKFSSDEDEDDGSKDYRFRRKTPLKDDRIEVDRVHHDKYRFGRNDPERKVPELTRIGDKYASNYESSRDIYRKNNSWHRESDRHKSRDNRDKYELSQRSRRHYSPERERPYNIQGDYYNKHRESNDRHYRSDNVRHRTLISPPLEAYNQHRRSRDLDGQRVQHEPIYPMKHKILDVVEEPACKRFRSDSLNKQSDKYTSSHDRDVEGHACSMSKPLELSYLSLQSPDYVHLENNAPILQIKEIKSTSDTKLDDPRLTSKKYIVSTQGDKLVLSTVVGRDVDVKAVDTAIWNTHKGKHIHEMPAPLRQEPPINEDLVKDIYMGIDEPISNLSLESGEICLEEEMGTVVDNKSIVNTGSVNAEDNNNKSVRNNDQNHDRIEVNKNKEIEKVTHMQQTCPTLFSKNYKIPKVKKSDPPKLLEDDSTYSTRNKLKRRDNTKQDHKRKNSKEKKGLEKKLQPETNNYKSLKNFSDAVDVCKNKRHKLLDIKHRKRFIEKSTFSARDTVEGDLELSDETCDYVEISDETRYDYNNCQKFTECNKNTVIDSSSNKDLIIGESGKSDFISKNRVVFEHEIEKLGENKHFNLSHKSQEVLPKELLHKPNNEQKSKDIKSKLCDLFGDTSSLITLDDLGIVAPTTTKENLNDYAPLFDNTQDAVDLNVEEMEKVQTRSMTLKRDEDKPFKVENQELTSEKSEKDNGKNSVTKENKKSNNVEKSSSVQHIFKNVNVEPEDNTVVKTVIISTGMQNNCNSMCDGGSEKQLPTVQRKTNDNATSCPGLLNMKALATSTPYKPQNEPLSSVPEISCNSNNSATAKNASNISPNSENISKTTQNNLDIPDVRIIVKRRRKVKGAP